MHHCGIPRRSQPMRADQILAEYFRGILVKRVFLQEKRARLLVNNDSVYHSQ